VRFGELLRLVAWKTRQRSREWRDTLGGFSWLERRGQVWARAWRPTVERKGLAAWLARRGGGAFWFSVQDAAEWARTTCTAADITCAEATSHGVFDVMGSGPVAVGDAPTWRMDLYSGREWPLTLSHRLDFVRGDGSDTRTVCVMSRCEHFLPLARAYWSTGGTHFRDAFIRHVTSWLANNPLGRGPNWICPMDAALRAANWVLGLVLFAPANEVSLDFWESMLANLVTTGLYLERYLEWHPVYRGNHYLADGAGLVYLGTLLRGTPEGERWLRRGAKILASEIHHQVHPDGTSFEASLSYHRLATELFTYAGELVKRNASAALPREYEPRLRGMYDFIAAYVPSSGDAPVMGDGDDGRLHAISARALAEPRRHRLGLPTRHWQRTPLQSQAFPDGGFYVMRRGTDHLVVRCGRVGLRGAGSHDHNDHLSLELVLAGRRIVTDSGTYAYTRDLAQRFAFRSTAAHSVVQVEDEEQNPIAVDRPWRVLADRTRSETLRWEQTPEWDLFEGQHHGYAHRPSGAVCRRRILARWPERRWEVTDEVIGHGVESLTWRLHLAATEVRHFVISPTRHELLFPGCPAICLTVEAPTGMELAVRESAASDRYGVRYTRPCLVITGPVTLPARFETTFTVDET